MTWFLVALVGPVLWGVCNQLDRYFLRRWFAHEALGTLMLFSAWIGVLVLPVAWWFSDPFRGYAVWQAGLLLASGVASVYGIYLYLLALRDEEASVVVPFWQMVPVFGYAAGWLVLGEALGARQIAGALVILAAAAGLSIGPRPVPSAGRMKWRLAGLMSASSLIFGLQVVVFKFVAERTDFWGACFWEYAGYVLAGAIIWIGSPASRAGFLTMIRRERRGDFRWILGLNMFAEIITLIGNLATNLAALMAPVALVLLVGSLQPAIVLLLGIAGTLACPRWVCESLDRRHLLHKCACIAAMCAGASLM